MYRPNMKAATATAAAAAVAVKAATGAALVAGKRVETS